VMWTRNTICMDGIQVEWVGWLHIVWGCGMPGEELNNTHNNMVVFITVRCPCKIILSRHCDRLTLCPSPVQTWNSSDDIYHTLSTLHIPFAICAYSISNPILRHTAFAPPPPPHPHLPSLSLPSFPSSCPSL
jgi:hypothetical protein